ncbi:hypothetical protein K493DRAFT_405593 [Basidiobolus meristosporus CBS 931.73]|uniref:polynucleotide adenylyltransferase n=1 Tax=Basidiobolus meristosporus CBS 931.73 TaxID=1314790 RepID=A0A1Y1YTL6_9FUNG|nr:hypothetical protein K493DRAFT_405593 [Basidiobolus meristosporus CBS 931.73]|eukprot:ORY01309.1 hypothetical protein K493DRAFT_405593 [Basidiobolus meristosporus CBS 931.73]
MPDIESSEAESGPYLDRPLSLNPACTFQRFFSLKYEKILTFDPAELLCKDFCLVTSNQKHLILASACPSTASSAEACRYPSSLSCMANLDDITFYIMEIETGKICDRKTFKSDFIYLSHHSGVSLYGQFFAITSLQNQCIHVFQIKENGTFVGLRTIGWYNYDDDELELAKYDEFNEQFETRQRSHSAPPDAEWHGRAGVDVSRTLSLGPSSRLEVPSFAHRNPVLASLADNPDEQSILFDEFKHNPPPLSGFKHRLLAYLYKKAKSVNDNGIALQNFYLTFSQFESLVLWKAQFLDETHLLVKLSSVECVTGRNTEGTNQTAFFVIYNIDTTMIIALYENTSEELLSLFEHHSEYLRGPNYNAPANFTWTWSNNAFARLILKKQQYAVRNARNGGPSQAVKRVLAALPYSPQSFSESPYFDPALFSYDEKAISASDRPKPCQDFPIKFYLRSTGELKFKINTNVPNRGGSRVSNASALEVYKHMPKRKRKFAKHATYTDSFDDEEVSELEREEFFSELSQQVNRLCLAVTSTREDEKRRELLYERVDKVLKRWNPDTRLFPFGSTVSGFGLKNSDVDFCVCTRGRDATSPRSFVTQFGKILSSADLGNVITIPQARVPIIKLQDRASGLSCDIGFNNIIGVYNALLLKTYSQINPELRRLVTVVKHWAKSRRINEPFTGTLNSYGFVLMSIFFMQQHGYLPVLQQIRTDYSKPRPREMVNGCNTYFFDDLKCLQNHWRPKGGSQEMGQLLYSFFNFYANEVALDRTVVSIRTGTLLDRGEKDWHIYTRSHGRMLYHGGYWICIEDPFQTENNVGRVVNKFGHYLIRQEFKRALSILNRFEPHGVLKKLCEPYKKH